MLKAVLVGTTALALLGSSLVYAQQRGDRGRDAGRRGPVSIEDMRAFSDARLAALKAGLALTADQEKNWPAFEQAAKDLAKLRIDRMTALRERMAAQRDARRNREQPKQDGEQAQQRTAPDPVERLRQRGTMMAETGAALKTLADATDPLYKSLDDKQKRRFAILSHIGRQGGPGFGRREHRWRDGEHRDHRRGELMPGHEHGPQFGPGHRGPRREGFERGQRHERSADRGTETL